MEGARAGSTSLAAPSCATLVDRSRRAAAGSRPRAPRAPAGSSSASGRPRRGRSRSPAPRPRGPPRARRPGGRRSPPSPRPGDRGCATPSATAALVAIGSAIALGIASRAAARSAGSASTRSTTGIMRGKIRVDRLGAESERPGRDAPPAGDADVENRLRPGRGEVRRRSSRRPRRARCRRSSPGCPQSSRSVAPTSRISPRNCHRPSGSLRTFAEPPVRDDAAHELGLLERAGKPGAEAPPRASPRPTDSRVTSKNGRVTRPSS